MKNKGQPKASPNPEDKAFVVIDCQCNPSDLLPNLPGIGAWRF